MLLKIVQSLAYENFIAYEKFLTNFSSFFPPTFRIEEDALLIKPFQKAKQGSVVHRQFAADECDRYLLHIAFVKHFSPNGKIVFTETCLLLTGRKQEKEDFT